MNREQKTAAIAEIVDNINGSDAVLVVDYRGLTVTQAAELRDRLRETDATLVVAKNTLTGRAVTEVGESAEPLRDFLTGPSALTYVKGDVAAAAKAITTFAKDNGDLPAFKGGVLDGKGLAPAEIEAIVGADAYVMGRHMFGPGRGEHDLEWTGWWGDEPPYRAPVFVLSHHEREPLVLQGGTTFTFVTSGLRDAFDLAVAAAGDEGRVSIAGGASTLNQFLAAGLVDELRLHVVPVLFGAGQRLFEGVPPTRLEQVSSRATRHVTHQTYRVLR